MLPVADAVPLAPVLEPKDSEEPPPEVGLETLPASTGVKSVSAAAAGSLLLAELLLGWSLLMRSLPAQLLLG